MSKKVRVAIVGLGWGLNVHLAAFRSIPDYEVVALCSRTKEKVERIAKEYGIPRYYTDYEELVGQADIDVISIATPVKSHYPYALSAIRKGKHVICEKPLTLNAAEAKELYLAAKEAGVAHVVCHELRWMPERLAMKELLADHNYLGDPYYIQFTDTVPFWHPAKPVQHEWIYQLSMGGGYLYAVGSHDIDFLRSLFGDIAAVNAQVVTTLRNRVSPEGHDIAVDADDTSILNLRFVNGAVGVLTCSSMALHAPRIRLEAYGSKGSVLYKMDNHFNSSIEIGGVDDQGMHPYEFRARQPKHPLKLNENFDPEFLKMNGGIERIRHTNAKAVSAMTLLCEDFLDSIRNGAPIQPSLRDGWKVLQVIDAARKSSASGQWVEITED